MVRRRPDTNTHWGAPLAVAGRAAPEPAPGPLRGALRGIRWYVRALMGDDAYDAYLARHGREHPGQQPLTVKEFWKQRVDDRERNPTMRCC